MWNRLVVKPSKRGDHRQPHILVGTGHRSGKKSYGLGKFFGLEDRLDFGLQFSLGHRHIERRGLLVALFSVADVVNGTV